MEEDSDLRPDLFDFCIFGETVKDVLGTKFATTSFSKPGSRIETRKAILQRVVNDPNCSDTARKIALGELGNIDYPKLYEQNKGI